MAAKATAAAAPTFRSLLAAALKVGVLVGAETVGGRPVPLPPATPEGTVEVTVVAADIVVPAAVVDTGAVVPGAVVPGAVVPGAVVPGAVVSVETVVSAVVPVAVEVADCVGGVTVMVTPASAQNFSRSAGRASMSACSQAFSAQGVTMGVSLSAALQTQGKSVASQPVDGTAERMQLRAQGGRSDRFWA